ncbi:UNVERIFIED_ORG: LCP family protein required for cell wall assembly [Arthrobacter sp. UYCu721]
MASTPSGPDPIGPASSGPEPAAPAAPKRRRVIAAVLTLVLVAVVAVSALLFSRPAAEVAAPAPTITDTATPTPSETTPPPAPAPPPPPEPIAELPAAPMNILVIGSDSRANAREQAAHTAATGESQDHRSDSLMVVHVPADRRALYVISIMRDLWVEIPGYGGSKVNASLEIGGIDLTARTVESLLGIHLDHTLMIDFNGFRALTDGLGGVDVNVPFPFQSTHDTGHLFSAGVNHLDGQAALEFSRERYAFTDGDFQRVQNQRIMLRAILARLTVGGALNDVTAVRALADFAACCLTVNKGFDPVQVAILAYSLRNLDVNAIGTMTLPTAGVGTVAGQSVVFPDYGGINAVAAALRDGRIGDYAAGH